MSSMATQQTHSPASHQESKSDLQADQICVPPVDQVQEHEHEQEHEKENASVNEDNDDDETATIKPEPEEVYDDDNHPATQPDDVCEKPGGRALIGQDSSFQESMEEVLPLVPRAQWSESRRRLFIRTDSDPVAGRVYTDFEACFRHITATRQDQHFLLPPDDPDEAFPEWIVKVPLSIPVEFYDLLTSNPQSSDPIVQFLRNDHFGNGARLADPEYLGTGSRCALYRVRHSVTGAVWLIKRTIYEKYVDKNTFFNNYEENDVLKAIQTAVRQGESETDFPALRNGLCQFVGSRPCENTVDLLFEYMPGADLRNRILHKNQKFDQHKCKSVAVDICTAMAALHRRGVVHRNIALENLIYSDTGTRIVGFGSATANLEKSGASYSDSVDCHSVGVCLIMLLASNVPALRDVVGDSLAAEGSALGRHQIIWDQVKAAAAVDDSGIEFIDGLIAENPSERLTFEDALQAKWIRHLSPSWTPPKSAPKQSQSLILATDKPSRAISLKRMLSDADINLPDNLKRVNLHVDDD
ncbi:unnamed protein product [Mycena citricolor]|uniref:Protein kinase domain-containing protein n=1 Tax=Mycena citricolor TaxID=2018698 RepID=A0AAD2HVI5_9AGAR|nr:unnamed protein product [Mycena citricolor]